MKKCRILIISTLLAILSVMSGWSQTGTHKVYFLNNTECVPSAIQMKVHVWGTNSAGKDLPLKAWDENESMTRGNEMYVDADGVMYEVYAYTFSDMDEWTNGPEKIIFRYNFSSENGESHKA